MQEQKYVKHSYGNLDIAVQEANKMSFNNYRILSLVCKDPGDTVIVVYENVNPADEENPAEVIRKGLAKLTPKKKRCYSSSKEQYNE